MSGGFEAIGDIATGALAAHAVEPRAGHAAGEGAHGACLNCRTALIGGYCHACGQSAHIHRTLGAIWHDIAHGVLHFEGKTWRTLPMIAWRPGELTRRYVHGERARFISPLAFFLFTMFVMFAMLQVAGKHLEAPEFSGTQQRNASSALEQAIADNREDVRKLSGQRAQAAASGQSVATLDASIAQERRVGAALSASLTAMKGDEGGGIELITRIKTGWARLDKGIAKAVENPNLLLYKLQTNAYKFSWALIPISLPFMWLLFPFSRRFRLYDHAVFVTYSLSFMSMLAIALSVAAGLGLASGLVAAAALLLPALHMYRQLRGAYGIGRWSGLVRTIMLLCFAFCAVTIFLLLLIALGLVG